MRHSTPMILLALLTAVVPGCNCLNDLDRYSFEGDDDMGPMDLGPDMGEADAGDDAGGDDAGVITCNDLGVAIEYEIASLEIPSDLDVLAGRAIGHDLDGTGSTCNVPDYQDNVDNSFIELAEALTALSVSTPIYLQQDIDEGLACLPTSPTTCSAAPWTVQVRRGTNCAQITILHGRTDAVLAGPFLASVDGVGNVRGEFDSLQWVISHQLVGGGRSDVPFIIRDGVFTARMSELLLSDIVIGGSLLRTEVEATFTQTVDELSNGTLEFSDIEPILANLYDVNVAGTCERLSVGLRASASRCPGAGPPRLYRLTTLHIPEDSNEASLGHDVDGRGSVCGVPDYPSDVDNSMIDLAAALPAFSPDDPVRIQTEIDAAINCAATGPTCTRLDIFVSVAAGDQCALVSLQDGAGVVYAAQRAGTLTSGELSVRLPTWTWALPVVGDSQSLIAGVRLQNVILTADVTASTLTNVVLGGYTTRTDIGDFTMRLLLAHGEPTTDVPIVVENLLDVERFGMCSGFSIGFTATGTAVP